MKAKTYSDVLNCLGRRRKCIMTWKWMTLKMNIIQPKCRMTGVMHLNTLQKMALEVRYEIIKLSDR